MKIVNLENMFKKALPYKCNVSLHFAGTQFIEVAAYMYWIWHLQKYTSRVCCRIHLRLRRHLQ